MGCFDTDKLSDSRTGKRLRNGPFAENGRGLPLVQTELMLERSAPDNLPEVACGVLKPSAQQQGVQDQRQDGDTMDLCEELEIRNGCILNLVV